MFFLERKNQGTFEFSGDCGGICGLASYPEENF